MTTDTTIATGPHQPHDEDDPTPGGASLHLVPAPAVPTTSEPADAVADKAPSPRRRAVLPRSVIEWHARGRHARSELADAGMATAEYAIATLAAVGFAGLLVVILKGDEVKGLLMGIIRQALSL